MKVIRRIGSFGISTGMLIVLNISFNENAPTAYKPEEALVCFLRTKMDDSDNGESHGC